MKMFYHMLFVSLLVLSSYSFGQFQWKHAGPDNIGTRTRSILYHNGKIYAGSAGGGLWYSEDNGVAWKRQEGYASAKCSPVITCMTTKGNTLMVGTGEVAYLGTYKASNEQYEYSTDTTGYFGSIGMPGQGIYTSDNGGDTWSNDNATTKGTWGSQTQDFKGPFTGITKILVHSSGRIYVGTRAGLFYSDDNLQTLDTVHVDIDTTLSVVDGVTPVTVKQYGVNGPLFPRFWNAKILDIEEGPDGVLFVGANADFGRTGGWYLRSTLNAGLGSGRPELLASDTLVLISGKKIKSGIRRVELAIAPSNNNIMYLSGIFANGELSGIWRSEDKGRSWSIYAPPGNPGFTPLALTENRYNSLTMAVSPENPDNVIIAGNAWYTYSDETGWLQTAQGSNPGSSLQNYVPSTVYCVAYNPSNAKEFFVGTDKELVRSQDGGKTFSRKHKGYEAALAVSAASVKVTIKDPGDPNVTTDDIDETKEAILMGTANNGLQYNGFFNTTSPTNQAFGRVNNVNWSDVQMSYMYPDAGISQKADQSIVRTNSYGEAWEEMFGFPISPVKEGIKGLTISTSTPDTIIDRQDGKKEGGDMLDRKVTNLNFYGPNISQFVLDEVIPDDVLLQGKDSIQKLENYVFFCSGKYLWRIENPLGSPDKVDAKWNRISNSLVSGDEFITAITVSGDSAHTVYIGTSAGKLFRVNRPHDLRNTNLDLTATGTTLKRISDNNNSVMKGRWVSSLSVDPTNTKRLVVTYAGYGNWENVDTNKVVIMTEDATVAVPTFTPLGATLPNLPVYTSRFVVNPDNNQSVLFVGTEKGLYVSSDLATFQQELESEIGNVPVVDISVRKYSANMTSLLRKEFTLKKDNTVFVTAYGKGVYTTSNLAYQRNGNDEDETPTVATTYAQLYPNPATNNVTVKVSLKETANVTISLKGIDGRELATIPSVEMNAGNTDVQLLTQRLASGVYFIEVTAKGGTTDYSQLLKLMIAK